jgi:uncharacterized protein YgiM (DUF1202 family)
MVKKTIPVKPHRRSTHSPTPRPNPNKPKTVPVKLHKRTSPKKIDIMKILLIILSLVVFNISSYGQSKLDKTIASCCEEGRGCTGSSYCTACKNCTGCRYCAKNGGSCGVCSSGSRYTSSKKKSSYTSIKQSNSIGENLSVSTATSNLRKGPSTKFKIIEKLFKNEILEVLEVSGSWLKVKVKKSGSLGYVYAKYVKPVL